MDLVARNKRLLKTYGITVEEYYAQFRKQKGKCACCGRPHVAGQRPLDVDHDHQTGRLRGLLCFFCNKFVIGSGRVNALWHRKAASYLESPPWEGERYVPGSKGAGGALRAG